MVIILRGESELDLIRHCEIIIQLMTRKSARGTKVGQRVLKGLGQGLEAMGGF